MLYSYKFSFKSAGSLESRRLLKFRVFPVSISRESNVVPYLSDRRREPTTTFGNICARNRTWHFISRHRYSADLKFTWPSKHDLTKSTHPASTYISKRSSIPCLNIQGGAWKHLLTFPMNLDDSSLLFKVNGMFKFQVLHWPSQISGSGPPKAAKLPWDSGHSERTRFKRIPAKQCPHTPDVITMETVLGRIFETFRARWFREHSTEAV